MRVLHCILTFILLADVDISLNSNPFNFWTSESEYIKKKTGIRIHFFQESIYGLESEYISFSAIEYEYNYPWRDMDLSPILHSQTYN